MAVLAEGISFLVWRTRVSVAARILRAVAMADQAQYDSE